MLVHEFEKVHSFQHKNYKTDMTAGEKPSRIAYLLSYKIFFVPIQNIYISNLFKD